jgi:hypothetical protein
MEGYITAIGMRCLEPAAHAPVAGFYGGLDGGPALAAELGSGQGKGRAANGGDGEFQSAGEELWGGRAVAKFIGELAFDAAKAGGGRTVQVATQGSEGLQADGGVAGLGKASRREAESLIFGLE